jgi:integrase
MASFYRDNQREGYRVQVFIRGVRRKLWIGNVPSSAAKTIAAHLERLKLATETGTLAAPETLRWSQVVSPRIRSQLARWGLIELGHNSGEIPSTIGDYTRHYLETRPDLAASTLKRLKNSRQHLLKTWPAATSLASITPGDCDRFARTIRSKFQPSHAGKTIGDARQFFAAAVRDKKIADNPFAGISCAQPHDRTREAYISRQATAVLLTNADPFFAALIAAARFGGLRVPSEPLELQWTDIDWQNNRFTVRSRKTKNYANATRVVPLFPELLPHLRLLQELAFDGSINVFDRARSSAATTWRDNLLKIITSSGQQPWDKLWQNLRASCRTDLNGTFPDHVVSSWMGHSSKIGKLHYDRIHEEHYAAAVGQSAGHQQVNCGAPGGAPAPTTTDTTRQPGRKKSTKNAETIAFD